MTLEEKLQLLHGPPGGPPTGETPCAYVGIVAGVKRLGIPPINMNDGPQGFRDDPHPGSSTAWPAGLTMAASWDPEAVFEWGSGMGQEFYKKGSNVQLGPGLCVARVPRNGRNFEYLSGEDPFLGKSLVGPAVKGIQSQKVVANAKHWVLNNQETARQHVSSEIDERTRFEMYYPPFEAAIQAGVGSFMCSYNKINGAWSCENPTTLGHDLKKVLGFKGYVMSDWGATHSMSIMEGLDVEQPAADWMNEELIKPALAAGSVTQTAIDDSVTRILWSMFSVGVMAEPESAWDCAKLKRNVTSEDAVASARKLSAISTVLLKNEGDILPLQQKKRFAVLGLADENALTHGGGSGEVIPAFVSTPLAGIAAAAGDGAIVKFNNGSNIEAAAELAAQSDYAIIFAGTLSSEGSDRTSLSLDDGTKFRNQNALISAVAKKAGQKAIVVLSVPGAVVMPWSADVAAILTNFMPGQEAGNAIADVLFGKVNPSGKLPLTFPNLENETKASQAQWPGIPNADKPDYAYYTEKLLVGYRFYDAHEIEFTKGFPFGHGLSYTKFDYSSLVVSPISSNSSSHGLKVSFIVKNAGMAPGAEVAQLYLTFPKEAGEPPQQLKGFEKTKVLKAGEQQEIELILQPRELSIWDVRESKWSAVGGSFEVRVGASSRDIRLQSTHHTGRDDQRVFI
eukprot:TRINITY_DN25930_c0_g1_i1.p1 TRINITY_DN25930_c0_g1~~TRINITY_DN25930_c0_g1_i1.p1  ORF type:complete len:733 (+),score=141.33 TRINITY_DN25930_c0_g1_i1:163-2199(+)